MKNKIMRFLGFVIALAFGLPILAYETWNGNISSLAFLAGIALMVIGAILVIITE